QPDPGDLAQRGVRLLWRGRVHARAHAPALRALLERRRPVLRYLVLAALADQLLDRGQPRLRLSSGSGPHSRTSPVTFIASEPARFPGGSRPRNRGSAAAWPGVFYPPPTPEVGRVALTGSQRPVMSRPPGEENPTLPADQPPRTVIPGPAVSWHAYAPMRTWTRMKNLPRPASQAKSPRADPGSNTPPPGFLPRGPGPQAPNPVNPGFHRARTR